MVTSATDVYRAFFPAWFRGIWGERWIAAVGSIFDPLKGLAKEAVKTGFVLDCGADALPYHGRARSLPRADGETDDAYRVRLSKAWSTWQWAGTDYGIMLAFEAMGWTITHLDDIEAGGYWPALWPTNEAGDQGNVWVVSWNDWGAATPIPAYTNSSADIWLMLDYHSHVTDLRRTGWIYGGQFTGSPGTTSAMLAEVRVGLAQTRTPGADAPTARSQAAMTTYGGDADRLVMFGGQTSVGVKLGDTWIWWEHADCWTQANPSMPPSARFGHCMAEFGGAAYMFGGTTGAGVDSFVWKFEDGEWSRLAALDARTGAAMAELDGKLYVFGGVDGGGSYTPEGWSSPDGATWSTSADYPEQISGLSIVNMGDYLLGFGGYDGVATYSNRLYRFTDATGWEELDNGLGTAPPGRHLHGAARISETELLIWGGLSSGGAHYDVWRWDGFAWHSETDLPATWFGGAYCGSAFKRTQWRWDDGTAWDDGSTWSTSMTAAQVKTMRTSIAKWKDSARTFVSIIVKVDAGHWGGIWGGDDAPFFNWGMGSWGMTDTVVIPVIGA